MDAFIQTFLSDDKPLTLGILVYIVYMLHKSDQRQTKAIKWLKRTLSSLLIRVDNLEKFNQRKFPQEWRTPTNIPQVPVNDDGSYDDDL